MRSVKEAILLTASYYRQSISEEVLALYAADLEDLPKDSVLQAYGQYRRNSRNRVMPLPAQIRELIKPSGFNPVLVAREIAARITGGVVKFGYSNWREAAEYIGPVGWDVVKSQGGWQYLCEIQGVSVSPGTLQAQLRDQIAARLEIGMGRLDAALELEQAKPRTSDLLSSSDVIKNLIGMK